MASPHPDSASSVVNAGTRTRRGGPQFFRASLTLDEDSADADAAGDDSSAFLAANIAL